MMWVPSPAKYREMYHRCPQWAFAKKLQRTQENQAKELNLKKLKQIMYFLPAWPSQNRKISHLLNEHGMR